MFESRAPEQRRQRGPAIPPRVCGAVRRPSIVSALLGTRVDPKQVRRVAPGQVRRRGGEKGGSYAVLWWVGDPAAVLGCLDSSPGCRQCPKGGRAPRPAEKPVGRRNERGRAKSPKGLASRGAALPTSRGHVNQPSGCQRPRGGEGEGLGACPRPQAPFAGCRALPRSKHDAANAWRPPKAPCKPSCSTHLAGGALPGGLAAPHWASGCGIAEN